MTLAVGQMKPQRWEKVNTILIVAFSDITATVAPLPSMAASEVNKLPPSFSGFESQKLLYEPSYDGVSGTDYDEQSKSSPDFKTAVYFL